MDKQSNPTLFIPIPRTLRPKRLQSLSLKTLITVKPQIAASISKSTSLGDQKVSFSVDYTTSKDCSCKLQPKDQFAEDDEDFQIIQKDCECLIPLQRKTTSNYFGLRNLHKQLDRPNRFDLIKPMIIENPKL